MDFKRFFHQFRWSFEGFFGIVLDSNGFFDIPDGLEWIRTRFLWIQRTQMDFKRFFDGFSWIFEGFFGIEADSNGFFEILGAVLG